MVTEKHFFRSIAQWALIWLPSWLVFFMLDARDISYASDPEVIGALFLLTTIVSLALFWPHVRKHLFHGVTPVLAGIAMLVYMILWTRAGNFTQSADYIYVPAKIFEIVFQQSMLLALISFVMDRYRLMWKQVLASAAAFAILHIPIILFLGLSRGLFFVVASFVGSAIWTTIILRFRYGYVYTFTIHILFYAYLESFYGLYQYLFSV